jgi:glycerol-3-phosphate cytidylyltransferase
VSKMKKVITYGTFDLIHHGHINILRKAKEYGDYLIVGLSSDEFNILKGKEAYYSYDERKLILEAIKYVDEVIPEHNWNQKSEDIQTNQIDLFVMGSDWEGKFDDLNDYCEVIYLPRTEGISTTKIKTDLYNKPC